VNSNRFALLAISLMAFASTGQTNSTPIATKNVKRATLVSPASTPAMPAAPDLSYIRPLRLGVQLGWQDSQPHKGSYRVTYGKFGESHHAHLIDVDSPPVEIGNLEAGTTYYFSVYFIDGITHRSSNYSNEQSLVVSPTGTEIAATATPSPIETATPSFTPYTRSTSSSAGGAAAGSVLVGGFFLWVIRAAWTDDLRNVCARPRAERSVTSRQRLARRRFSSHFLEHVRAVPVSAPRDHGQRTAPKARPLGMDSFAW